MDEKGWACATQLYEPEIVVDVHRAYIDAGADVVITNTYATNRNIMEGAGLGERTDEAIHKATECACDARCQGGARRGQGWPLIAGSLSAHPPELVFDASDPDNVIASSVWPAAEREEEAYAQAASTLADSGVDMLFCEMMKNMDHAPRAVRGAAKSGLPVFIGISTRLLKDGRLVLWGDGTDEMPVRA